MQGRLPMDAARMVVDVRSVPTYHQSNAATAGMSLVLMSTTCAGRAGVLTTSATLTPAAVDSIAAFHLVLAEWEMRLLLQDSSPCQVPPWGAQ